MPASPSGVTPDSEPASQQTVAPVASRNTFAPKAAIFSLAAPVAAGLLGLVTAHLRTNVSATGADWPGVIITVSGLLLLVGLIAAIFGLTLGRRPGQKATFGLAVAGLLLNFIILLGIVLPAVSGLNKVKTDKRLSLVAGNSYLQKLQQASNDYYTHLKSLKDAQVLDMKGVNQKEELEARKTLVRQFIAANEQLKSLFANAETLYKQELARVNLSQPAMDVQLAKYRRGAAANEQAMKIRDADTRIGNSLLDALNFLDENWGKWNYSSDQKRVVFSDQQADGRFHQLLAALDSAAQEQAQLNEQLVSAQRH